MHYPIIKDNIVINTVELEPALLEGENPWTPEDGVIGPVGGEIGDEFHPETQEYSHEVPAGPTAEEQALEELQQLDHVLSRSEEDIIDVLISKKVATLDDFGTVLKDNYMRKVNAREKRKDARAARLAELNESTPEPSDVVEEEPIVIDPETEPEV